MGSKIESNAATAFVNDGFVFPMRAISGAEAADAVREIESIEARNPNMDQRTRDHEVLRFKSHLRFPFLDCIAHSTAVLDAVEALIGPDILIWSSSVFIKEPGDGTYFGWHQDSCTYELEGDELITAWIALSPATVDNGAMRFLPGSHRRGPLQHEDTWDPKNLGSRGERLAVAVDDENAVDVALSPGEASLHHLHLMHESRPNRSARRRIGYAVRYMSPAMRHRSGKASVTPARGRADAQAWTLEPRPTGENEAAVLDAYRRSIEERVGETLREKA
ncbi:MAG: phytanoyl-CoA dioxygenase family protein [Gammaproteobacteria bacterium]